jgi:hypothetical protein
MPAMGACFASMCSLAARDGIGIGVLSLDGTWVAQSRNILAEQSIEHECDYILFVDDDMVFPPDTIHRLLDRQKDIVGVLYSRRGPPFGQIGTLKEPYRRSGCHEAIQLGTGVILIKTTVFSRLQKPWFLWTETHSDDIYFIEKCLKAEVEVWCDLDLSKEIGHIGTQMYTLNGFKPETYGVTQFSKLERTDGQQNSLDCR